MRSSESYLISHFGSYVFPFSEEKTIADHDSMHTYLTMDHGKRKGGLLKFRASRNHLILCNLSARMESHTQHLPEIYWSKNRFIFHSNSSLQRPIMTAFFFLLSLVIPFLFVVILSKLNQLVTTGRNGPYPPGPKPKPFIGNMLDFPTTRPAEEYGEWRKKYNSTELKNIYYTQTNFHR